GQDLVQSLLLLGVRTRVAARAASAADRVKLVDEHDRRSFFACPLEEVANATGADTNDHLDELGGVHAEEGHARLAGDGPSEQCLAGSRRAHEEYALGCHAPESRV